MRLILLPAFVILSAAISSAQTETITPTIAYVEGAVSLNGQRVEGPATLPAGSVVSSENGRAEIHLRNGVLFLGDKSSARISGSGVYNFNKVEMLSGSAVLKTGAAGGLVVCENTVTLSDAGIFQLDLRPPAGTYRDTSCSFKVYQGAASVQLLSLATVLTSGKTMRLNHRCGDMIPSEEFAIAEVDALHQWSRERAGSDRRQ